LLDKGGYCTTALLGELVLCRSFFQKPRLDTKGSQLKRGEDAVGGKRGETATKRKKERDRNTFSKKKKPSGKLERSHQGIQEDTPIEKKKAAKRKGEGDSKKDIICSTSKLHHRAP